MILALLAVALGALAQNTVGFGLGLVSVSFLIAAIGPADAIAAIIILSLITNLFVVAREIRTLDPRRATLLALPSLGVQILLAPIIRDLDGKTATVAAGVVVLIAAGMLLSGRRAERLAGNGGLVLAGSVSATMNMTAGLGGPAAVLYATNAGWPPALWRPTINLYFVINNLASLVLLDLAPPADNRLYLAAAAGSAAGILVAKRVPASTVRASAIALAAAGGVLAIWNGLR